MENRYSQDIHNIHCDGASASEDRNTTPNEEEETEKWSSVVNNLFGLFSWVMYYWYESNLFIFL